MSYFDKVDRNDMNIILEILEPDDVRTRFELDFKEFSKAMDVILPDPYAAKFRNDLSFLSKVRALARNMYYDEDIELKGYGEKVKKLIDESIRAAETVQLIEPTKIDNKNFLNMLESYGTSRTRASAIEKRATKIINENEKKNPVYYKSLRQRLEEIIQELRNKKFSDAAKFKELQGLWNDLLTEGEKSASLGFETSKQFAIFNLLQTVLESKKAKELTLQITIELSKLQVIDWCEKENIQKEMRVKVKDLSSRNTNGL